MDALNYYGFEIKNLGLEKVWSSLVLKVWESCSTALNTIILYLFADSVHMEPVFKFGSHSLRSIDCWGPHVFSVLIL